MKITHDHSGLTVITESIDSPVFGIQLWFKIGSGFEKDSEAGYAHFLEHMVFKGTPKAVKAVDFATAIESIGGSINAYTSFDQTVYHASVSEDYWKETLGLLAQMTFKPGFAKDEMERERGVILEEIKQGKDNPWRSAYMGFFESIFNGHTYGRPVIGFDKTVTKVSHSTLKNFWQTYYHPSRCLVSVVGPGDNEELAQQCLKIIRPYLKGFSKKGPTDRAIGVAGKSPRFTSAKSNFKDRIACLGFVTGPGDDKDQPLWDLLATSIGHGDSSPLVSKLERDEQLVQSISTGCYGGRYGGALMVIAQLKESAETKYFQRLGQELTKILAGGIPEEQLERARVQILSEDIYSRETSEGLASKLAGTYFLFGGMEQERRYRETIERASMDDVQKIARKVFGGRWGGYGMFPTSIKATELKNALSIQPPKTVTKTTKTHEWNQLEIAPGVKLLHFPIRHVPMFSVRASLASGSSFENPSISGITKFTGGLIQKGAGTMNAERFSLEMEKLASSVFCTTGRNTWSYGADGLSQNSLPTLDLLELMVKEPAFPHDEAELLKAQTLHELALKEDDLGYLSVRMALKELFGTHAMALSPAGTKESVETLNRDAARDFHRSLINRPMAVVLTGQYTSRDIDRLAKIFGASRTGKLPEISAPRLPKDTRLIEETKQKEQSHVVVGFPAPSMTWERRFGLHVLTTILSGMGGRLFQNLREKKSLAYSVSPVAFETLSGGFFGVHMSTSPHRTEEAVEGIKSELKAICSKKVTQEELKRNIQYLVGNHHIDSQRISSMALNVAIKEALGLGLAEHTQFIERVKKVTAEEVLLTAQELFEKQPPVIACLFGQTKSKA